MSETPAVVLEDVDFAYDGRLVLERVNVTVNELDFVGVVGPNGAGKTTLLKLMLGLLKPTRGTVRLFGERPARTRRRVGYVPQSSEFNAHFPVTVLDVVLMGRLGAGGLGPYRKADQRDAAASLGVVGLGGFGPRPFAELSGGERQRVIIARSLVSGAEMLMLDEPTANVDAEVGVELYDLLRELNETVTVVLVSHDLAFVSKLVKTVLCVTGKVSIHPTCDLDAVTGDLLRSMYGSEIQVVRHDQSCQEAEPG